MSSVTPQAAVLVVGTLTEGVGQLTESDLAVRTVDGPEAALRGLEQDRIDVVVTPYDVEPISGAELAAVAHRRAGVPTVLVGTDIPVSVEEVPGVEAVVKSSGQVYDAVVTATTATTRESAADETQDSVTQRELRRQRQLRQRAAELAAVGGWEYDATTDDVYWTDGTRDIYEVEADFDPTLAFVESAYHPDDRARVMEQFTRALERGEPYDVEARILTPGGERKWIHARGDTETDPERVVQGAVQDITERKVREAELEVYETAIETAADAIYKIDSEGTIEMVNDALVSMTGYDRSELLGEHVSIILTPEDIERGEELLAEQLESGSPDVVSMEVTVVRADGSTFPAESRVSLLLEDGELRGTVGVTRDISDQRAHERTLTELHDVGRALLSAQSSQSISRTVANAADEILDIEAVGVYRFDDEDNVLRPEVVPETTRALIGDPPAFGPDEGIAWEVFVAGEPRIYDDVTQASTVHNEDTPIRSELLLPIGEHGVLICGSTDVGAYDDRTVELADLLAANAEAAYDRMRREHSLRDRDRELRERNRQLQQLSEIHDRVRKIGHELVGATTWEAVQQVVCDRLADVDGFDFVWIGTLSNVGTAVTPQYWAGARRGYLDVVSLETAGEWAEPTVRAARQRSPAVVDRVADELHEGDWQREALSRDYRSVASFPLQHDGIPFGTLSVYSNDVDAFDEGTQTVLAELAGTVAHALSTIEQRQTLLNDQTVDVTLGIERQPTALFTLAAELGGRLELQRVVPRPEGENILYGTLSGVATERFEAVCADSHAIDRGRVLGSDGDDTRFEMVLSGPCIATTIADHGGNFESLSIQDDHAVLSVALAAGEASEFIRQFTDRFPGAELLARRERQSGGSGALESALSELTDRQREALEVAQQAGFYDWPRESTAEEIAASMEISGPTFLEHLRRAEAKVIDALLAPTGAPGDKSLPE